jgi:3-hydroxymyristoyl/3-hydroxydecanoyl-(acyl carrier protein) dehydratase
MDAHFRAFSFVDQITSFLPGKEVRGRYAIPSGQNHFPLSLVGEAVGQLAAWAAMAELNFELRPVAGLAGKIELHQTPQPARELELAVELESVDSDRVAYGGTAHMDGMLLTQLQDCVGPMVPLADFDDPQAVRDRFALLCRGGAHPGGFGGLPALTLELTGGLAGQRVLANLHVPSTASLFADHFPRCPVFPGSLLMHMNLQLGAALAEQMAPPAKARWALSAIRDMKLRSFIPPGAALRLEAKVNQSSGDGASLSLETRHKNEIIATALLALRTERTE